MQVPESTVVEAGIPKVALEKTGGVGDVFFSFTHMGSYSPGDNWMFELTIVELNDQKLGLQYSEYFYNIPRFLGDPSGWIIKEAFNRRFDYTIAYKTIRFKSYEFEILGVDKGQIKYKRIK